MVGKGVVVLLTFIKSVYQEVIRYRLRNKVPKKLPKFNIVCEMALSIFINCKCSATRLIILLDNLVDSCPDNVTTFSFLFTSIEAEEIRKMGGTFLHKTLCNTCAENCFTGSMFPVQP